MKRKGSLFEAEIVTFLNATCIVTQRDPVMKADSRNLANFIRRQKDAVAPYWSNDARQQQQFFCGYLQPDTPRLASLP